MFDSGQLTAYLERIGHATDVRPDAETLRSVHRAHMTGVFYENLDIQLGRPISLSPDDLFDKVVRNRRGGFCYEMNGVLALALRAIGFEVNLVEGAVDRQVSGDSAWRNHVVLLVTVNGQAMIADTGLGDGFLEPLPLCQGSYRQGVFTHRVERLDDTTWRGFPDPHGSVKSFDFRTVSLQLSDFQAKAMELSTSPSSSFVRSLVVSLPHTDHMLVLRGRTVTTAGPNIAGGKHRRVLRSQQEFADSLAADFKLDSPSIEDSDVDLLWQMACEQHESWRASRGGTRGHAA